MIRKKRTTAIHLVLSTEEAMVGALNRHAELALVLKEEDAAHEVKVAALNTGHTEATQQRREELGQLETSIHLYATVHRAELFPDDKKSKEYANAVIGFRLNPPSVETLLPKESEATVALRLEALPWGEPYVKVGKVTLNKDALKRDRLTLTPEQLAQAGLTFAQAENFFIEPTAKMGDRVTKEVAA